MTCLDTKHLFPSLPPFASLLSTARVFSLIALARDDIHIQYGT